MDFESIDKIRGQGFRGFVTVSVLQTSRCKEVPEVPGVYLVIRASRTKPEFLSKSIGGWFKGKDPTVSIRKLKDNWVDGPIVIYIGKAGGLASRATLLSRLKQFLAFGAGKAVGHYGGRYIWQLCDSGDLQLCWKPTPAKTPAELEGQLIRAFKGTYGKRPFANLQG